MKESQSLLRVLMIASVPACRVIYKVYHAPEHGKAASVSSLADPTYSVVCLERAGPGVGGGVVFPFSVSVGFTFELLLSDVLISVLNVHS